MNSKGHIQLRRGLLEHIDTGRMKSDMLSVYTYLLLAADYTCGIVWHTSAPYIGIKLKKKATFINRQLVKLEKGAYIKRFKHRGQIMSYEIIINKYSLPNLISIDSVKSTDINNIAWIPEVKGELIGSYREVKCKLSVSYVSTYKEVKKLIIKEVKKKDINVPFEKFWELYDKKAGKKEKLEKKWASLTDQKRGLIMEHIPEYKKSQPDKKYRKNPETYLNNESWNDELVKQNVVSFPKTDKEYPENIKAPRLTL